MISFKDSVIVQGVTKMIVPFIQIFGLYVIFHGHYSPGGGFQGGALLAASVFLHRIVLGNRNSCSIFSIKLGMPLGLIGMFIYTVTGMIGLQAAHTFLDYSALPFKIDLAELRALGILLVEIGVGFAVMGTLIFILDQISIGGKR